MKKLIAIFSVAVLVFSFSLCAFAADPEVVVAWNETKQLYTATVAANAGANATLLVLDGAAPKLTGGSYSDGTNIDYIDQISVVATDTSTVFEFKFRTANGLADSSKTYTAMIGGSNEKVYSGTYSEGSSGFTISGTVPNANEDWYDSYYNEKYATTINLYAKYSDGIIDTTTVDPTEKSFSFEGLVPGYYMIEITRPGYLIRYLNASISDDDVELNDIDLYAGDFNESWAIDGFDADELFPKLFANEGDGVFDILYDVVPSSSIDGFDVDAVLSRLFQETSTYPGYNDVSWD